MNKINYRHLCVLAALAACNGDALAQSGKQALDNSCWEMSFEEPFDRLSLWNDGNPAGLWRTQYIWSRETIINNEQQYYIDPQQHGVSPFSINEGILSITATPTPRALRGVVEGQPYVSGVLTTEKSFSQQYGRFEVRAQLPEGQGLWSAFWLLPSFKQWPEGVAVLPEIDVMENLGHQPNTYHTTLHTNQTGELTSFPFDHTMRTDLTKDFHVYSVVWTPQSVSWYLDGEWKASHPTPADYTRPVHFLLNLAVGALGQAHPMPQQNFQLASTLTTFEHGQITERVPPDSLLNALKPNAPSPGVTANTVKPYCVVGSGTGCTIEYRSL